MKKYVFKNKLWLILSLISITLASVIEILKAFLLQYIIDSTSSLNNEKLIELIIMVITFITIVILVSIIQSFCCNKFILKNLLYIKDDLYNNITNKSIEKFRECNTSEYISSLTNDINIIESDYYQNLFQLIEYLLCFLFSFIAILKINYYFIIFIVITSWFPIIINKLFSKTLIKSKLELSNKMSLFVASIKDIFSGFETIKTYNINTIMKEKYDISNNALEDIRFKFKFRSELCERLSFGGSLIIWLGSLILGCFLILNNILTVGYVLGVSQLLNNIANPLYRVPVLLNKMKSSDKLFEAKLEQSKSIKIEGIKINTTEIPQNIIFKDVNLKINNTNILKNINFTFERGKKYAIIGESGSGKSSILKLLMRYYDEYDGNILIDEKELKNIDMENWYDLISLIQQNSYIFNDSISNNITLYKDYNQMEINNAVSISQVDRFINNAPEQYNTIIDENFKNISGGESQRISMARAFIRKTPLLLMDEVTSALNETMSYEIENEILNQVGNTIIVVTHKINPDLMKKYDCVILIKNGHILKSGSYDEISKIYGKI